MCWLCHTLDKLLAPLDGCCCRKGHRQRLRLLKQHHRCGSIHDGRSTSLRRSLSLDRRESLISPGDQSGSNALERNGNAIPVIAINGEVHRSGL